MDRVALVTGAGGGIGAATARALWADGYAVCLLDRDAEALAAVGPGNDSASISSVGDTSRPDDVLAAFDLAEATFGPVTAVVSAAGVLEPAAAVDTSDESWQRHLQVNATGTFNVLRETARRMIPRAAGSVVVISSNAAQVPRQGMAAYAASKAAASALTRCVGLELAPHGIRCNVIEPGSTDTAMQRDLWPDADAGARAAIEGDPATFRVGIPLGRIASPADIADTATFLLSDRARHITMQRILIDGGATL